MRGNDLRVLSFPKEGENPYLNQLAGHLERAGVVVDEFSFPRAFSRRYDVVHLHWPDTHLWSESWWRSLGKHIRLATLCLWLRLRRTRIVWTLHNLQTHEKDHWIGATLFPRWFPRACTDVIALSPSGLALLRQRYPALRRVRAAIVPHGHYRDIFPPPVERRAARRALGLEPDRTTFVFFGSIRRYKNVPKLIEAFRRLQGDDVQLVIAGQPVVTMRAGEVTAVAQGDPRVYLNLRHIRDSEIPVFLGAADLVVTPFADVLNSGSVMLALSLNRPVLAPRLGALPDLARVVGERWLQLYDGTLEAGTLARAGKAVAAFGPEEAVDLSSHDWPEITRATLAVYRQEPVGQPRPAVTVDEEGARVAAGTRS